MHGRTPENLLRALPGVLKNDASMFAIASSVADALSARVEEMDGIRVYSRIDELPEGLLDILAYDFKVDWWDADYTLAEKRQVLKDSWGVRRKLGTKAAVEMAISAIYGGTVVSEWFEYGGEPFCFKLLIDSTFENIDPEKHRRVLERVGFYKNLRSWLDGVEYVAFPQGVCVGFAAVGAVCGAIEMTVGVRTYGLG